MDSVIILTVSEWPAGEWQQSQDTTLPAVWPAGSQALAGAGLWRRKAPPTGFWPVGSYAGICLCPDWTPHRGCGRGSKLGQGATGMTRITAQLMAKTMLSARWLDGVSLDESSGGFRHGWNGQPSRGTHKKTWNGDIWANVFLSLIKSGISCHFLGQLTLSESMTWF